MLNQLTSLLTLEMQMYNPALLFRIETNILRATVRLFGRFGQRSELYRVSI